MPLHIRHEGLVVAVEAPGGAVLRCPSHGPTTLELPGEGVGRPGVRLSAGEVIEAARLRRHGLGPGDPTGLFDAAVDRG